PVIHRVQRRDFWPLFHLLQNISLQVRRNICKEHEFRVAIFLRQLRLEFCKDIQLGCQRHALVQILGIPARPEERLADGTFESFTIDFPPTEHSRVGIGEIVTNHSYQMYWRKETGRDREVCRCPAQCALHLSVWALQTIERYRTYD